MKILICAPYFADDAMVGSKRMVSLVRYLSQSNYKITVVRFNNLDMADLNIENVNYINVCEAMRYNSPLRQYIYEKEEFSYAIEKEIRKNKYDVFLVSMGPFSTCKAAIVAAKYNIKTIIDFRDLGVVNSMLKPPKTIRNKVNRAVASIMYKNYERRAVNAVDHIVTVCPGDKEIISSRYKLPHEQISVILNGYDDLELNNLNLDEPDKNVFRVGYFGKLMYYAPKLTEELIDAISKLRSNGIKIELYHIGAYSYELGEYIKKKGYDVQCYNCVGKLKYQEGIKRLGQAQVCYIEHCHPTGLGTKLFDYIYLNRPILLGVVGETYLEQFISRFSNAVALKNKDEMMEWIIYNIKNYNLKLDKNLDVKNYSRSVQNKKMQNLIKNIVGE